MGIFDLFPQQAPGLPPADGSTGIPSIGGVMADVTNISNLVSGKAKSADYGAGIGAGIGAFFGAPQQGADIGRTALPILNKTVRPFFSDIWHSIAK